MLPNFCYQLLPNNLNFPDGTEIRWPNDDRVWVYHTALGKFIEGPRTEFDGGDCWDEDDHELPWVI